MPETLGRQAEMAVRVPNISIFEIFGFVDDGFEERWEETIDFLGECGH